MHLNSSPYRVVHSRNDPPILTRLCERLNQAGALYQCDLELRADSIYGPLRLKTEPALIGIRKRRAQHRDNAYYHVFASFRQSMKFWFRASTLSSTQKQLFIASVEKVWLEEVHQEDPHGDGRRITARMVYALSNRFVKVSAQFDSQFAAKPRVAPQKSESIDDDYVLDNLWKDLDMAARQRDYGRAPTPLHDSIQARSDAWGADQKNWQAAPDETPRHRSLNEFSQGAKSLERDRKSELSENSRFDLVPDITENDFLNSPPDPATWE